MLRIILYSLFIKETVCCKIVREIYFTGCINERPGNREKSFSESCGCVAVF